MRRVELPITACPHRAALMGTEAQEGASNYPPRIETKQMLPEWGRGRTTRGV